MSRSSRFVEREHATMINVMGLINLVSLHQILSHQSFLTHCQKIGSSLQTTKVCCEKQGNNLIEREVSNKQKRMKQCLPYSITGNNSIMLSLMCIYDKAHTALLHCTRLLFFSGFFDYGKNSYAYVCGVARKYSMSLIGKFPCKVKVRWIWWASSKKSWIMGKKILLFS